MAKTWNLRNDSNCFCIQDCGSSPTVDASKHGPRWCPRLDLHQSHCLRLDEVKIHVGRSYPSQGVIPRARLAGRRDLASN